MAVGPDQSRRAPAEWRRPLEVLARQCTGRGARGVVCAAAPMAAQAGAAVLRGGGNAYDAVVAMALAEAVLLPPKCGLGGDLIALASSPSSAAPAPTAQPEALVAVGGAPAGLAAVAEAGEWRDVGPLSVGPPGAPGGYLALADRGQLPLTQLAAPAIALARDGFPWAEVCTDLSRQSLALLTEMNPAGCRYLPGGEVIDAGTVVRLPGLADAIESFAELGGGFLAGPVGNAIVREVRSRGGVLDADDFRFASATWTPCAQGVAAGRRVWATPAPTHGPSLLDAIADAAASDGPAASYQRVMRAIRRRADTLSDPGGTSMVSAADRFGNVVVVVHSNSYPRFGSGIIVADYDLVVANRAGRGFTPQRGHPNFPAAGRRPATTLHAWAAADAQGAVRFFGGTPGGDNQMPWNAQTIGQILSGEEDPGVLVTAPRWEWLPADDGVRVEGGFGDDEVADLEAVAPRVVSTARLGMRSAQQVIVLPANREAFAGAADPRTVGAALGV